MQNDRWFCIVALQEQRPVELMLVMCLEAWVCTWIDGLASFSSVHMYTLLVVHLLLRIQFACDITVIQTECKYVPAFVICTEFAYAR